MQNASPYLFLYLFVDNQSAVLGGDRTSGSGWPHDQGCGDVFWVAGLSIAVPVC